MYCTVFCYNRRKCFLVSCTVIVCDLQIFNYLKAYLYGHMWENQFILWIYCICKYIYVTLDHKTSLKCQFFLIEIHPSSEIINKLSIDAWFVRIRQYFAEIQLFGIWNLRVKKNLNTEKVAFKVFQIKFLAMHITNQILGFDIFTVINVQNISMEHDLSLIS